MIGMLRGRVWEVQLDRLILDVHGVGYALTVPHGLSARLHQGQEVVLYTQVIMREDDLALFGFTSAEEKQLFLDLTAVSGIGPKAGMAILSTYSVDQIQTALASENVNLLTKVPGIGKKTAQRLVLELKDRFKGRETGAEELAGWPVMPEEGASDALATMLALGFGADEARLVLTKVRQDGQELSTEELVTRALRYLGNSRA